MQPLLVEMVKDGCDHRDEVAAQLRILKQVHSYLTRPPEEEEESNG